MDTVSRKVSSAYDPMGKGPVGEEGGDAGDPGCAVEVLKLAISLPLGRIAIGYSPITTVLP